jgi:hypothetical protein
MRLVLLLPHTVSQLTHVSLFRSLRVIVCGKQAVVVLQPGTHNTLRDSGLSQQAATPLPILTVPHWLHCLTAGTGRAVRPTLLSSLSCR